MSKAKMYAKNSREYRIDEIRREAKEAARHIKDGDAVLEVASGPGYLYMIQILASRYT